MTARAESVRSSLIVTFSVLRALFLREAVQRLFNKRVAWLWLLAEPIVHIVFLLFIFTVVRLRSIGGIDTAI
jgi:capsular polysaccharide transport system permease protein